MSENSRKILNIILAVLISVSAWTYVVYNHDPMIDVRYRDIPIVFTGEDTLASRGYGIRESNRDTIDVMLTQKRVDTAAISAADITVTADVSEAVEGDNGISLNISGPDGTQVLETSARSVSVEVGKAESRTVDILVDYEDSPESSAEPIATDFTSRTAAVVGAESEVSSVDKVVAYLSYSELTDKERNITRQLTAIDSEGNIIPHIVIYPSEIKFSARSGVTKTVRLDINAVDKSEDNYNREFTGPETITIKGSSDAIAGINSISTEEINLSFIYEEKDILLSYELPEGVFVANDSLGARIHVTPSEKPEDDSDDGSGDDSGQGS